MSKWINDPIWGRIWLTPEEYNVVNTIEMLRLNRMRQNNFVFLVYPSATHTRFSHALGTRYLVEHIIEKSKLNIPPKEKRLLFLSALLNDVAHPCFDPVYGNLLRNLKSRKQRRKEIFNKEQKDKTIEKLRELKIAHKGYENDSKDPTMMTFVCDILDGDTLSEINKILNGEDSPLSDFLDGQIDADNLEWIKRDASHIGFTAAVYDPLIYESFRIENKKLVLRDDPVTLSVIDQVLFARWFLFKYGYFHHAVTAANAMLQKALLSMDEIPDDIQDAFFLLGDDEFLLFLLSRDELPDGAKILIRRLFTRRLYKRAFMMNMMTLRHRDLYDNIRNPNNRKETVENIAEAIRNRGLGVAINPSEILVGYPFKPPEKDLARIHLSSGMTLIERNPNMASRFEDLYNELYVLSIFTSVDDVKFRVAVNRACYEIYGEKGDYLEEQITKDRAVMMGATLSNISQVVERIRSSRPAALKVLRQLCSEESLSTEELMQKTNLKKPSISVYMKLLSKRFSEAGLRVVSSETKNKIKYWSIPNRDIRHQIANAVEMQ